MNLINTPPAGFLNAEVIDGYEVSAEMKKVWAVQLDMLQELLRICDKYKLKIFADGGTLIGAMRHHGYIPWDDDIDMVMLRPDYDKLCEVAPSEFKYPHFFQTVMTDDHYTHRHAQIRNCDTAIWSAKKGWNKNNHYNQGIFIDIFILDGMPDNPRDNYHFYKRHNRAKLRWKIVSKLTNNLPDSWYHWLQKHTSCLSDRKLYAKYENLMREHSCDKSYLLCKFSMRNNHFFKRAACYSEIEWVDFEYIKMPVPKCYDELLTVQFGDWRTPTKSPSYHGTMNFDTEHSYKDLITSL